MLLAIPSLSLAAVAIVIYFVYYDGRLGPQATERYLRTPAMESVDCVRGWERLSTWSYVCTIRWGNRSVTGHIEVNENRVTGDDMLP